MFFLEKLLIVQTETGFSIFSFKSRKVLEEIQTPAPPEHMAICNTTGRIFVFYNKTLLTYRPVVVEV